MNHDLSQNELFDCPPDNVCPPSSPAKPEVDLDAPPRLLCATRSQVEIHMASLDELLEPDHDARLAWAMACGIDLSALYDLVRVRGSVAGRPAIDPKILFALWLYATFKGVGPARELARLCESHIAYKWICGGVSVNYHTLADFRVQHGDFLDDTLSSTVQSLLEQGLVSMDRVSHDGMRVRAHAGEKSFRRRETLEAQQAQVQAQIEALKQALDEEAPVGRKEAAERRAMHERERRLQKALDQMPEAEKRKAKSLAKKGKKAKPPENETDEQREQREKRQGARVSSTDPEAHIMKMADNGFRPALNVQLACDTKTLVITGVDLGPTGSDLGLMAPMLAQHQERYGRMPSEYLVDGGYAKHSDIEKAAADGVTVYTPVLDNAYKNNGRARYTRGEKDSEAIGDWRERMGTDEAQVIYRDRAATIELVNAHARNRGLRQFTVAGLKKAKAVVLWYALANNLSAVVRMLGWEAFLEAFHAIGASLKGVYAFIWRYLAVAMDLLAPSSMVTGGRRGEKKIHRFTVSLDNFTKS